MCADVPLNHIKIKPFSSLFIAMFLHHLVIMFVFPFYSLSAAISVLFFSDQNILKSDKSEGQYHKALIKVLVRLFGTRDSRHLRAK